jgi:hypothetical protein
VRTALRAGLTIKGVAFSRNVQALGAIIKQVSAEPSVYLVELLFSFKGITRVWRFPRIASSADRRNS